jgi:hypothetical protein
LGGGNELFVAQIDKKTKTFFAKRVGRVAHGLLRVKRHLYCELTRSVHEGCDIAVGRADYGFGRCCPTADPPHRSGKPVRIKNGRNSWTPGPGEIPRHIRHHYLGGLSHPPHRASEYVRRA